MGLRKTQHCAFSRASYSRLRLYPSIWSARVLARSTGEPVRRQRTSLMLVHLLKSKIHRAYVTAASVDYEGSLTIDEDLMEAVGILPYERILCSNMANGARWETYAIRGPRGSGAIELNGAVAHLGTIGNRLTIMSFSEVEAAKASTWEPRVIVLGEHNRIINSRGL